MTYYNEINNDILNYNHQQILTLNPEISDIKDSLFLLKKYLQNEITADDLRKYLTEGGASEKAVTAAIKILDS